MKKIKSIYHSVLRFVITRKLFRRVFPYGLLIGYLFLEMYAAYNQKRDLFADRFTVLGLILLFFSLYLLKIRIKGKALAFSILFLWILGLILTVHTAFLFGNGNGFSLENSIHILQPAMFFEYIKMCPDTALLLISFTFLFPWLILASSFLLYWSIRPLPKKNYVRYVGKFFCLISVVVLFGCFAPAYEVGMLVNAYRYLSLNQTISLETGVKFSPVNEDMVKAKPGRNLVFIILESTELGYLNEDIFPGLLPNLKKFSKESQLFSNLVPPHNGGGTYGGMYAMMTGAYLTSTYLMEDRTQPGYAGRQLSSFPRILNKAGYKQYFLMGCSGNFAQMDRMIREQHYDIVWYGIEQSKRESSWKLSVRDSAVFEQAWKFFQQASKEKQPFNITLLTIDAHGPNGFYDPSEPAYPVKDNPFPIFNAMYASDHALGKFLDRIRHSPAAKDTCIVITSDHLAHMFTNIDGKLGTDSDRRMLFLIWNSTVSDYRPTVSGMTFDEAPTILDALGVRHNYTFPLGESLYSSDLDERRVDYSIEQERSLISCIALKSFLPVRLPERIVVASQPYPRLCAGKSTFLLQIKKGVSDLPHGREVILLPIPHDFYLRSSRIECFDRLNACSVAMKKMKNYLFVAENNQFTAPFFQIPQKKGYILGLCVNGKTIIKCESDFDRLCIEADEVRKLM